MYDTARNIEQLLTMLAATPPRLAELTAGLKPAQLQTPPTPDGWSINDVLAHLRSCADMWGDAMVAIINQDKPTLRAVNPRTSIHSNKWITKTDYPQQKFQSSFRAFTKQRADLLAVLEPFPRKAWSRTATMTGAGTPLERTVLSYAQRLARHERSHVKQIERIVNTMRM